MTVTDALTPYERRQQAEYLVEAVLAAAFGERDEARRLLYLADRILPLSNELYQAVLDPPIDPDDIIKNTDLYQELEAKYLSLHSRHIGFISSQITRCKAEIEEREGCIDAYEDMIDTLERDIQ